MYGGPILAAKWSGRSNLAKFSAKISLAGPILGGTDFGVTSPFTIIAKHHNALPKSFILLEFNSINTLGILVKSVTQKVDPPFLVPPGPNISKYLDPRNKNF